jgi:acetyl esterase/lipase
MMMKILPPQMRRLLAVLAGCLVVGGVAIFLYVKNRYKGTQPTHADIFYTGASDPRQSLDIYLPAEDERPAPVVMMFHGSLGNKTDFRYTASRLTSHGFAVVLPSYRIDPITYEDAFCALAWTHTHAKQYDLDTEHVFVIGWSSGGGVAAETAAVNDPNDLLGDCPHVAPVNWVDGAVLLAAGSDRWPESGWRTDTQPVTWIDGNEPPVLLIHGEQDGLIPADDSVQLASILQDSGDDVQLILLPEADHFFPVPGNAGYDDMLVAVIEFLSETGL